MSADDYHFYSINKMPKHDIQKVITGEIKAIGKLGGLYNYDFHSQYVLHPDHLEVIQQTVQQLRDPNIYFTHSDQISEWWRVRANLISGVPIGDSEIKEFQPVRLTVNEEGELRREPISKPRKLSSQ